MRHYVQINVMAGEIVTGGSAQRLRSLLTEPNFALKQNRTVRYLRDVNRADRNRQRRIHAAPERRSRRSPEASGGGWRQGADDGRAGARRQLLQGKPLQVVRRSRRTPVGDDLLPGEQGAHLRAPRRTADGGEPHRTSGNLCSRPAGRAGRRRVAGAQPAGDRPDQSRRLEAPALLSSAAAGRSTGGRGRCWTRDNATASCDSPTARRPIGRFTG